MKATVLKNMYIVSGEGSPVRYEIYKGDTVDVNINVKADAMDVLNTPEGMCYLCKYDGEHKYLYIPVQYLDIDYLKKQKMKRFKDLEIGDYIYRVRPGKYIMDVSCGPVMVISLDNGFMRLCSKDFGSTYINAYIPMHKLNTCKCRRGKYFYFTSKRPFEEFTSKHILHIHNNSETEETK